MDLLSEIREGGILYILLVIAITMHEFGHAYVADKLGDRLPRAEGRVTLNPLAHMDMMGTVILPILTIGLSLKTGFPMVFGWGKPVRVLLDNPKTRRKVDILSTLGGVSMNLAVALVSVLLFVGFERLGWRDFFGSGRHFDLHKLRFVRNQYDSRSAARRQRVFALFYKDVASDIRIDFALGHSHTSRSYQHSLYLGDNNAFYQASCVDILCVG